MLELQRFIKENPNWESILVEKPYNLIISRKGNLILFRYNQIASDFSLEIVKEARGIILEDETFNVVCYPLYKFFNYGETNAAVLDWQNGVSCQEKVDGSLIKVFFYDGEWRVATNGTIDARDADLDNPYYKNFRELFNAAAERVGLNLEELCLDYTYVFELYGPFNRIVVPYNEIGLKHLSTRRVDNLEEVELDIGIPKPLTYTYQTLDDCIEAAKGFDFTQEGFVIVDHNYNRLKCKSPQYVAAHRMLNNGNLNIERAIDLIRTNEIEEFLNYFPNYKEFVNNIKNNLESLRSSLNETKKLALFTKKLCSSRAEYAKLVQPSNKTFTSSFWFAVYDNPELTSKDWLDKMTTKKLAQFYSNYF